MPTSKIVINHLTPVQITDGSKAVFIQNRSNSNIFVFSALTEPTSLPERDACYIAMAHLAYLDFGDKSGNGGNSGVGRISSASEGSVSVSFDMPMKNGSESWFFQSKYGAEFWQALNSYRQFFLYQWLQKSTLLND